MNINFTLYFIHFNSFYFNYFNMVCFAGCRDDYVIPCNYKFIESWFGWWRGKYYKYSKYECVGCGDSYVDNVKINK